MGNLITNSISNAIAEIPADSTHFNIFYSSDLNCVAVKKFDGTTTPVFFGGNAIDKLLLNASTTSHPHINFTSGVAPTSPVNGDFWFDGTNFKARVGGVTKTFTLT